MQSSPIVSSQPPPGLEVVQRVFRELVHRTVREAEDVDTLVGDVPSREERVFRVVVWISFGNFVRVLARSIH